MRILAVLVAALGLTAAITEEPKLVGEGVISTRDDESGFALTPDGKTAFFTKSAPATDNQSVQVICITHLDSAGHWTQPEIAPFSGEYQDLGPAIKPDGSRLYFVSNRPNHDPAKHDLNIWYVGHTASGWSAAHALPAPVNSDSHEYGVSVAANGTLYFASNRSGGSGSLDIYRSKLEDGEYKTVENLGNLVNTPGPELQPAISPDESILVFLAAGRDDEKIAIHKEYSHGDLYVSFQKNGAFTAARNCGVPINSGAGDSWPSFSSDGTRFFFSSERGFATYRPARRFTWAELKHGLTSTLNGMGNIYEISASALSK